ncbi:hypothetical protein LTR49_025573 [Elasticomyces elasticus]|nr:hypothetical protein LTR49_025573 [Elasticomyces elasticus]
MDQTASHQPTCPIRASVKLDIIIAGAGLGGLATAIALARSGHSVRVFEQAPALAEVGAGIQVPPNSTRMLLGWGLGLYLANHTVEPESINMRRWQDGTVIGHTKLIPDLRRSFDGPYLVMHRAQFHDALYHRALELGVEVILDSKIIRYDGEEPAIELANGDHHRADIVIAADGIKSLARQVILGDSDTAPVNTGYAVYRATVDVRKIAENPELAWILEKPSLNIWIGNQRHVMTYLVCWRTVIQHGTVTSGESRSCDVDDQFRSGGHESSVFRMGYEVRKA